MHGKRGRTSETPCISFSVPGLLLPFKEGTGKLTAMDLLGSGPRSRPSTPERERGQWGGVCKAGPQDSKHERKQSTGCTSSCQQPEKTKINSSKALRTHKAGPGLHMDKLTPFPITLHQR
jgi:hypothetical protein